MAHENSETIRTPQGWINIVGGTRRPLSPRFAFEQWVYPTVEAAVNAARQRSRHTPEPPPFEFQLPELGKPSVSDYSGIRKQLQVDDPASPGNALADIVKGWLGWRMRQLPSPDELARRQIGIEDMPLTPLGAPLARAAASPISRYLMTMGRDDIIEAAKRGIPEAIEHLITQYAPRAEAAARRFIPQYGTGAFDDLVQAGREAIPQAIRRLSMAKPGNVDAFVDKTIRWAVDRAAMAQGKGIAVPEELQQRSRLVAREIANWEKKYGQTPNLDYIARKLGMSREELERARVRLDPVEVGGFRASERGMGEAPTPEALRVTATPSVSEQRSMLDRAGLTANEKQTMIDRFGFGESGAPMTVREIAKQRGLKSPNAIQKQVDSALAKFRKAYNIDLKPPQSLSGGRDLTPKDFPPDELWREVNDYARFVMGKTREPERLADPDIIRQMKPLQNVERLSWDDPLGNPRQHWTFADMDRYNKAVDAIQQTRQALVQANQNFNIETGLRIPGMPLYHSEYLPEIQSPIPVYHPAIRERLMGRPIMDIKVEQWGP